MSQYPLQGKYIPTVSQVLGCEGVTKTVGMVIILLGNCADPI
jgi:hypothetical protein